MPKVFVHGNPETSALWQVLFDELRNLGVDDLITLSPPGFGAPVPQGFEATQLGYRAWLISELEALGSPVDLVGHDWGAGHVYGVLAERPDLLRSWSADCAGLVHEDYVWHDAALAWQTPGVGEEAITAMFGLSTIESAARYEVMGVPNEIAARLAEDRDPALGECVLCLYRSAAQPKMQALGVRLQSSEKRPGLVLIATEDPYTGSVEMCESVANMLDASIYRLEGLGHWWMFEGAKSAADALVQHWSSQ